MRSADLFSSPVLEQHCWCNSVPMSVPLRQYWPLSDMSSDVIAEYLTTIWTIRGSISGIAKFNFVLHNIHTACGAHPPSYSLGTGVPPQRYRGRDVKLTDHSRPVGTEAEKDWSYRPLCSPRDSSFRCQGQLVRRDTKLLGQDRPSQNSDVNPGPCYAKQERWELEGDVAGL